MKRLIGLLIPLLIVATVGAIDDPESMPDLSDIPPHARPMVLGETLLDDDWALFYVHEDDFQVVVGWRQAYDVVTVTRMEFVSRSQRAAYIQDMEQQYAIILENYVPYNLHSTCTGNNGVSLDEFDAMSGDAEYDIRHYSWFGEENTLWMVGIYSPSGQTDNLDETSASFQPDLISCDSARDA